MYLLHVSGQGRISHPEPFVLFCKLVVLRADNRLAFTPSEARVEKRLAHGRIEHPLRSCVEHTRITRRAICEQGVLRVHATLQALLPGARREFRTPVASGPAALPFLRRCGRVRLNLRQQALLEGLGAEPIANLADTLPRGWRQIASQLSLELAGSIKSIVGGDRSPRVGIELV